MEKDGRTIIEIEKQLRKLQKEAEYWNYLVPHPDQDVILSIIDNMNKGRGEIKKAENNSLPFKFICYW